MNELHLFAGIGGGILGGKLLGHTCVCAVEIEPYCRKILLQRQRDGILLGFPIWDDIKTFDGNPWRRRVDVVCGGFPCQDISTAGKGAGLNGERSGLWNEMARVIREVRPRHVFVENSPALTIRGLGTVFRDLAEMGFDAAWGVFSAGDIRARHERERVWIKGTYANEKRSQGCVIGVCENKEQRDKYAALLAALPLLKIGAEDYVSAPFVLGAHNGFPFRVERTSAIGNAQVPSVAAFAWRSLSLVI